MRWFVLVTLAACGRIGFDPSELALEVSPAFPAAAQWTDYAAPDGGPCDYASESFAACVHGGETRVVRVTGATSCTGYTVTDALGAFAWTCREDGETLRFTSRLATRLGDLVTATGWKLESVTLAKDGKLLATSPSEVWWTNPVLALATADVDHAVYVVAASRPVGALAIAADHVSIVTLGDAELSWDGAARDVVETTAHDALWLEVAVQAIGAHHGIALAHSRFSRIDHTTVHGGGALPIQGAAIALDAVTASQVTATTTLDGDNFWILVGEQGADSSGNYLAHDQLSTGDNYAIYFNSGIHNLAEDVLIANYNSVAIQMGSYCDGGSAYANTVLGARLESNADGIFVSSNANAIIDLVAANTATNAIALTTNCGNSYGTVVAGATLAYGATGLAVFDKSTTLVSVVAIDNDAGAAANEVSLWWNIAAADNAKDITESGPAVTFEGNVLVSGTTSCTNSGALSGLAQDTCAPIGASTATVQYTGALLPSFVGAVSDVGHPTDSRAWLGPTKHQVYARSAAGRWTTGQGGLLDLTLRAADSVLLAHSDGSAGNGPFVAGSACPAAVDGNRSARSVFDGSAPNQTFLANAIEIVSPVSPGYGAGDHDGLCESFEHCLYAPNFGAYQGEGALVSCAFHDGTIAGVTMFGYATNGAP